MTSGEIPEMLDLEKPRHVTFWRDTGSHYDRERDSLCKDEYNLAVYEVETHEGESALVLTEKDIYDDYEAERLKAFEVEAVAIRTRELEEDTVTIDVMDSRASRRAIANLAAEALRHSADETQTSDEAESVKVEVNLPSSSNLSNEGVANSVVHLSPEVLGVCVMKRDMSDTPSLEVERQEQAPPVPHLRLVAA